MSLLGPHSRGACTAGTHLVSLYRLDIPLDVSTERRDHISEVGEAILQGHKNVVLRGNW
jgi:hypothetical protein